MTPIVNGLEEEFQGQMAFEQRDANSPGGKAVMDAFHLRSHPSFVIIDPNGQELWTLSGQVGKERLHAEISQHIE